jgi:hypothetical protein
MGEVTPTRKGTLFHNFKACEIKNPAPVVWELKGAWSSATAPLSIVCPTDNAVPPERRDVFVNDRHATFTQHSIHLIKHEARIVRVMQHVAKQHGVEALIFHGKVTAIVGYVIDARRSAIGDVEAHDSSVQHALQMMRDKTVATTDVENVSAWRQHSRDLKGHVVCATDFAASAHASEATFDDCGWSCHRVRLVQPRCPRKS